MRNTQLLEASSCALCQGRLSPLSCDSWVRLCRGNQSRTNPSRPALGSCQHTEPEAPPGQLPGSRKVLATSLDPNTGWTGAELGLELAREQPGAEQPFGG